MLWWYGDTNMFQCFSHLVHVSCLDLNLAVIPLLSGSSMPFWCSLCLPPLSSPPWALVPNPAEISCHHSCSKARKDHSARKFYLSWCIFQLHNEVHSVWTCMSTKTSCRIQQSWSQSNQLHQAVIAGVIFKPILKQICYKSLESGLY